MATAPQGSCVDSVGVRAAGGKHLENELQCGQRPCLRPQCSQEAAGTLPSSRGSHHTTTIRASPHAGLQPLPRCWDAPWKALQPLLSGSGGGSIAGSPEANPACLSGLHPSPTPCPRAPAKPLLTLSLLPGMSASTLSPSSPCSVFFYRFLKGQPRGNAMRRPPDSATPNASHPQTGSEAPILFYEFFSSWIYSSVRVEIVSWS